MKNEGIKIHVLLEWHEMEVEMFTCVCLEGFLLFVEFISCQNQHPQQKSFRKIYVSLQFYARVHAHNGAGRNIILTT